MGSPLLMSSFGGIKKIAGGEVLPRYHVVILPLHGFGIYLQPYFPSIDQLVFYHSIFLKKHSRLGPLLHGVCNIIAKRRLWKTKSKTGRTVAVPCRNRGHRIINNSNSPLATTVLPNNRKEPRLSNKREVQTRSAAGVTRVHWVLHKWRNPGDCHRDFFTYCIPKLGSMQLKKEKSRNTTAPAFSFIVAY